MNPIEIAALQDVITSAIVAGTFLITAVLVLRVWMKRGAAIREGDAAQIIEGIDTLTHSIEELRHEVSEINDRIEFTERLLTRVAEGGGQAGERRLPDER